jgi:hypothetical protein
LTDSTWTIVGAVAAVVTALLVIWQIRRDRSDARVGVRVEDWPGSAFPRIVMRIDNDGPRAFRVESAGVGYRRRFRRHRWQEVRVMKYGFAAEAPSPVGEKQYVQQRLKPDQVASEIDAVPDAFYASDRGIRASCELPEDVRGVLEAALAAKLAASEA